MAGPLLLLAALPLQPAVALPHSRVVTLEAAEVRLGDVVDLRTLPAAQRKALEGRVVARLAPGRFRATVSREALAALVKRAAPGLNMEAGAGEIVFQRRGAVPARPACVTLARPVRAGERLSADDVESSECGTGAATAAIRFERRSSAMVASADLAAGTALGALRLEAAPAVAAGQKVTLVSRAGPVSVAREVVALQPGRGGGRVFVKDSDGTVISVPVAKPEEAK